MSELSNVTTDRVNNTNDEAGTGVSLISLYLSDEKTKVTTHNGFKVFNEISQLLEKYTNTRKAMDALHLAVMGNRHSEAFSLFCDGCDANIGTTLAVDNLFNLSRAFCALDESYWQSLLAITGVGHFMPADRRNQWDESLRRWRKAGRRLDDFKPVAFTEENVLATAKSLTDEKKDYFAEMVEGVFENLSSFHKTNKSQCFSLKLIITNCLPCKDNRYHYCNMAYLNDLRKIVGLMNGRPGAEIVNGWALSECLSERTGEWITIDNGALQCKGFQNGNVHILLSQKTVDHLNIVLSWRMPNLIPKFKDRGKAEQRKSKHCNRTFELISKELSFPTCTVLAEIAREHRYSAKQHTGAPYNFTMPSNVQFLADYVEIEIDRVFRILGGTAIRHHVYSFDYWPLNAFKSIAINGCLPDQKTHQFYPTTGELQKMAMDECDPRAGMTLLEPSIGFGSLLHGLPEGVAVTGIEINNVAAMVAGERWNVLNTDFLKITPATLGLFDRILMNPPYSEMRWQYHLIQARKFIKPGGRIVAILPASASEKKLADLLGCGSDVHISGQYKNAFEGAEVTVNLVIIDIP